jgi:hypothetical protein
MDYNKARQLVVDTLTVHDPLVEVVGANIYPSEPSTAFVITLPGICFTFSDGVAPISNIGSKLMQGTFTGWIYAAQGVAQQQCYDLYKIIESVLGQQRLTNSSVNLVFQVEGMPIDGWDPDLKTTFVTFNWRFTLVSRD